MSSARLSVITYLFFLFSMIFSSLLCAQNISDGVIIQSDESTTGQLSSSDEDEKTGQSSFSAGDDLSDTKKTDVDQTVVTGESPTKTEGTAPVAASSPTVEKKDDGLIFFESKGIIVEASQFFALRSFYELFPSLTTSQKHVALSRNGLRHSFESDEAPAYTPDPSSGINNLYNIVMQREPSHLIEALIVIPYDEKELDLLDVYNALGRIDYLKDQTIRLRNGSDVNVFKETTRLNNAQNRRAIPDPPPALTLPHAETMYLRFTDAYIGSLFFRADISMSLYGMTYNLTNFRDISFAIFRIMKSERVSIILYLEPVKEGILIYSVSGLYLPGFIVNRMNLTPNINNRISVLIRWITEGLRAQEDIVREREKETLLRNLLQNEHFLRIISNAE